MGSAVHGRIDAPWHHESPMTPFGLVGGESEYAAQGLRGSITSRAASSAVQELGLVEDDIMLKNTRRAEGSQKLLPAPSGLN